MKTDFCYSTISLSKTQAIPLVHRKFYDVQAV
jgi:hypothetical protein